MQQTAPAPLIRPAALALLALILVGCASTSIAIKEAFGYEKREQLVDRVTETRDAQEEAKEQFASTLDELKALTGQQPGELEAAYERLQRELDRSEDRADAVRGRIKSVETVAGALFSEWESELDEYSSASLRRASAQQLETTRARYDQVLAAMKRAESRMEPVLDAFRDQVLFLKHNLNARAIAALDDTVVELEGEIGTLIADMESSIDEANAFIDAMSSS